MFLINTLCLSRHDHSGLILLSHRSLQLFDVPLTLVFTSWKSGDNNNNKDGDTRPQVINVNNGNSTSEKIRQKKKKTFFFDNYLYFEEEKFYLCLFRKFKLKKRLRLLQPKFELCSSIWFSTFVKCYSTCAPESYFPVNGNRKNKYSNVLLWMFSVLLVTKCYLFRFSFHYTNFYILIFISYIKITCMFTRNFRVKYLQKLSLIETSFFWWNITIGLATKTLVFIVEDSTN